MSASSSPNKLHGKAVDGGDKAKISMEKPSQGYPKVSENY
jgi:hypothetical protein